MRREPLAREAKFEDLAVLFDLSTIVTPGQTMTYMQVGIIEALQGVFVAVLEGDAFEVESTAARGFYYLL